MEEENIFDQVLIHSQRNRYFQDHLVVLDVPFHQVEQVHVRVLAVLQIPCHLEDLGYRPFHFQQLFLVVPMTKEERHLVIFV